MTIREGDPADIPGIRVIAHATWPVAYGSMISPGQIAYMLEMLYGEESLLSQMTEKGHRFLLAELEGADVGYAGFEIGYNGAGTTRLHKLYTLPAFHGKGIGRALFHAVEIAAREAGDTSIELNVNRSNPAKNFYAHCGFHVDHDMILDIGAGYVMDDHVMVKVL